MKGIVLLNIVTLFELDHALCLLFRVSKQTRRMIPSRFEYLRFMNKSIESIQNSTNRKQLFLFYDEALSIFKDNYYQLKVTNQNIILMPTKEQQTQNLIHVHPKTYKYLYPKANSINIHIFEPKMTEVLLEMINQLFPQTPKQLTINTNVPFSLALKIIPHILQFRISQNLILPIALLQQIKQVDIHVNDQPCKVKFEGTGKIGKNTFIYLIDCKQEQNQSGNLDDDFVKLYDSFIDFEVCMYIFKRELYSIKQIKSVFQQLSTMNRITTGEILLNNTADCTVFSFNIVFKKVFHRKLTIKQLTIKYCHEFPYEDQEVRVQILKISPTEDIVEMKNTRIYIDKKLIINLKWENECSIKLIECIKRFPSSVEIHIKSEDSNIHAIKVLQMIYQKKQDIKKLKIKCYVRMGAVNINLIELFDVIKQFKCLVKLAIPLNGFNEAIEILKQVIDSNRSLQTINIDIIKNRKYIYIEEIKSKKCIQAKVKKTIEELLISWQRHVDLNFTFNTYDFRKCK